MPGENGLPWSPRISDSLSNPLKSCVLNANIEHPHFSVLKDAKPETPTETSLGLDCFEIHVRRI